MTMTQPVFFVFLYCIILIIISMEGLLHYKRYKAVLYGEQLKQPLLAILYTSLRQRRFLRIVVEFCLKFGIYFYAFLLYPYNWMLALGALLIMGRLYVLWMPVEKLRVTKWDFITLLVELIFLTLFTASLLVYEA